MILETSPTTSEAFYIVIGAIIAFIIAFAAVLTAIGVIWAKLIKPVRDNVNSRLFAPLEKAVKEVADISQTLHSFDTRLTAIEQKIDNADIAKITEKVAQLEETELLTRETLRYLAEKADRPIFYLNDKKECIFVNTALCELLDVDKSDLEYRNWTQKIHPNERAEIISLWNEAYANNAPFDNVQSILIGSGTLRAKKMRVFAKPIIDKGRVIRYVGGVTEPEKE